MAIGQQANRRDLLPSNTVATKQLLVCRLTRPGGHNDAETSRIEARALESAPTSKTVTLQQMSGGHNKITAESGSIEDRALSTTTVSYDNDQRMTRILYSGRQNDITHTSCDNEGKRPHRPNARRDETLATEQNERIVNPTHTRSRDVINSNDELSHSRQNDRLDTMDQVDISSQGLTLNQINTPANDQGVKETDSSTIDAKANNTETILKESYAHQSQQSSALTQLNQETQIESEELEVTEQKSLTRENKPSNDITSYTRLSLNSDETRRNDRIIRVSARKPAKPYAMYKAHFSDKTKPCWVPVTEIPPEIVAAFHVKRFQRKKTRKLSK
jgi:hypothetical protein